MLRFLKTYLACGLAFGAMDAVWLTQAGPRLYRPTLDPVLADAVQPAPAAAFYLLYVAGIAALASLPAAQEKRWPGALWRGALLGLVAYGAYDLTNQATLKVWSAKITFADMAWGAFASAAAAVVGYAAARGGRRGR